MRGGPDHLAFLGLELLLVLGELHRPTYELVRLTKCSALVFLTRGAEKDGLAVQAEGGEVWRPFREPA